MPVQLWCMSTARWGNQWAGAVAPGWQGGLCKGTACTPHYRDCWCASACRTRTGPGMNLRWLQVAPKDILFRGLNVRMVIATGVAEAIKVRLRG